MRTGLAIFGAVAAIVLAWKFVSANTLEPPKVMPYLENTVESNPSNWFRDNEGVLDRWFDKRVSRMLEEAADSRKMAVASAQRDSGQPVGSIGVLFGLVLTEIVRQLLIKLLWAVAIALVLTYFKTHIFQAICILIVPFVVVVLISWLVSRNVAYSIVRKNNV